MLAKNQNTKDEIDMLFLLKIFQVAEVGVLLLVFIYRSFFFFFIWLCFMAYQPL